MAYDKDSISTRAVKIEGSIKVVSLRAEKKKETLCEKMST
jgi:hypothetical protein